MGGGYVIVGIEEHKGRPLLPPEGLNKNKIDDIQKELLNLCHQIKPNYFPVVEPVIFQKKHILIIWVPGGQNRPYSCPANFSSKIKEQAGKIPFDDRMNHHAELSEIKLSLVREFLYEIKSRLYEDISERNIEEIGRQMNLIDGTTEYLKPKNIALMMFNDEPQKFFPYAQIELVHFQKNEDVFTEKIFRGPLNFQIQETLRYISNMIIQEKVIKIPEKAKAIRVFNYPYEAIEEAVVNAVYHKSYEIREPIEIRIYVDRIIILNYPGPDKSVRQRDMEKGKIISRRYRNRRIGEFLKELKLTEGRSTGIPKIFKVMNDNGSSAPRIETDKEVSINEVVKYLGYKKLTGNVRTALKKLIDKNFIEYTIPEKPMSKYQKYRRIIKKW